MAVPISNVTRRQVYAPSGAGGAGPYAFTFEILANTDIAVYKDDVLLTLTTHYTVVINANGTGSVTITAAGLALAPASPTQYAIVGNRTISRTTDFTTGGDFFANVLNDELDQQTIFAQQNAEGLQRALQAPQTDPTSINMTLPRASDRANKTLNFDANGNPIAGLTVTANAAANVATWLGTPSSANLRAAMTDETGTGALVFADAPTFSGNPTLSAGTANGVAYLNGSKVLTTGSALTFDGTNLGIGNTSPSSYNGAADNLVIGSSGSNGMTIVSGTANAGYIMFADGTTGQQAYEGQITYDHSVNQMWFNVNAAEQMRLTSTGLGIGTSSPGARLHVDSGSTGLMSLLNSTNANGGYITGQSSSTAVWDLGTAKQALNVGGASDFGINVRSGFLSLGTGNTERMRLDSSGRLGIGVTPNTLIDAGGASSPIIRAISSLTNNAAARMLSDGDTVYFGSQNSSTSGGNVPVVFQISGTERARIDSSGNLRIGLTSAAYNTERLTVYKSGNAESAAFINDAGANNYTVAVSNRATTGDNRFMVFATESSDTTRGSIDYNRAGGLVRYNTTSDYRAKDIIGPVQNPGATIDALKVYEGKMKGATQSRPMLVAHETQAHAPYAVSGVKDEVNEDGTPKFQQMDVSSLVPLLLAELQSLRARVAQLESKGA